MSDEQSIRDGIAQVTVNVAAPTSQAWLAFQGGENHREYVRRIAAAVMPLIRRIQAEALREASDEIEATFSDPDRRRPKHPKAKVSTDYVNDPQWAELIVRNRADRIERGETA